MDIATPILASLLLARGFFPRRRWPFALAVILAGTLADLDLLTALFGPGVYLSGHHAWLHSLPGTLAIIAIAVVAGNSLQKTGSPSKYLGPVVPYNLGLLIAASLIAALLHLLLDLSTSSGIALLWPFRPSRFAWDFLPATDPWILALLGAGLFLPEIFGLVSSEIGAKSKTPRGRNGALIALALVLLYSGARAALHAGATAQLAAHVYHGESPRRVAAVADTLSFFTWHGVVETSSLICATEVPATDSSHFDPSAAACLHKPEPSPDLAAAQQSPAARRFLQTARFPRASVAVMDGGAEIVIRDALDAAAGRTRFALAALVQLDPAGQIISRRIVWAREVRLR